MEEGTTETKLPSMGELGPGIAMLLMMFVVVYA